MNRPSYEEFFAFTLLRSNPKRVIDLLKEKLAEDTWA